MRVAYISNTRYEFCTETHVGKTLIDMGHDVAYLQEDEVTLDQIRREGMKSDLVLYTRTWGLEKGALDLWKEFESAGVVTASLHLDLYLGLQREDTLDGDPFWQTAYVFSADGDPQSQLEFERRGINHYWSPPAVFRDECVPGRFQPHFAGDVAFTGSYPYPHVTAWPYRDQVVQYAMGRYSRFNVYGASTEVVRNAALNNLYASAKVILGDTLCPGFTHKNYFSDRLTETLGRGGCLVFPYVDGLNGLGFRDGEHVRFYNFGDFEQLGSIIDELLDDEPQRERLKTQGQAFVKEHHTYHNRMQVMLDTIGLT